MYLIHSWFHGEIKGLLELFPTFLLFLKLEWGQNKSTGLNQESWFNCAQRPAELGLIFACPAQRERWRGIGCSPQEILGMITRRFPVATTLPGITLPNWEGSAEGHLVFLCPPPWEVKIRINDLWVVIFTKFHCGLWIDCKLRFSCHWSWFHTFLSGNCWVY